MTDDEIFKKFNCDRVTADVEKTDYYCGNPDAYRHGEPVPQGWMGI